MGLELITASTAIAGGPLYQAERGYSAAKEQKKAARAQREARRVSAAQQENERQAAIRQQIRQERIRRAQVISAAEAAGVSGASVETSTIGSGQTLAAAGRAFATGASEAAQTQTDLLQQAADFRSKAAFDVAQGQIGGAVAGLGVSAFTTGAVKFPTGGTT